MVDIGADRNKPWVVIGDLNDLMDNSKKLGGSLREEASFFPFRNMVCDCRLREVPSSGNKFSWAGERNYLYIQCCLDRALGNSEVVSSLPTVSLETSRTYRF